MIRQLQRNVVNSIKALVIRCGDRVFIWVCNFTKILKRRSVFGWVVVGSYPDWDLWVGGRLRFHAYIATLDLIYPLNFRLISTKRTRKTMVFSCHSNTLHTTLVLKEPNLISRVNFLVRCNKKCLPSWIPRRPSCSVPIGMVPVGVRPLSWRTDSLSSLQMGYDTSEKWGCKFSMYQNVICF